MVSGNKGISRDTSRALVFCLPAQAVISELYSKCFVFLIFFVYCIQTMPPGQGSGCHDPEDDHEMVESASDREDDTFGGTAHKEVQGQRELQTNIEALDDDTLFAIVKKIVGISSCLFLIFYFGRVPSLFFNSFEVNICTKIMYLSIPCYCVDLSQSSYLAFSYF